MNNNDNSFIDITVPVHQETPVWPGDPKPELKTLLSLENGDACHLSQLTLGLHTGTHVDAPLHFMRGGKDVASLALWKLRGEVIVIDATGEPIITAGFLEKQHLGPVKRILFKTFSETADRNTEVLKQPYRALDVSAARWLTEQAFVLCGIDGITIAIEEELTEVHTTLLQREIVIVENLNLQFISAGVYEIWVFPLLIPGAEAAPARVLIKKSRSHDRE